jgi:hypothetical protein
MAKDAERIALVVELATRDAKDKLGRELVAYKAQLALNGAFGNSRRWLGLADRLASSGRAFVDELATKIRTIATHGDALASYSEAVEGFLADLDHIYQDDWDKDRPFRRGDSPPPAAWQGARGPIEMALKLQQSGFDRPNESLARQADNWRVPTASRGKWENSDLSEWMTFGEACDLARKFLGSEASDADARSAIISRANDGLLMTTASRTELVLEETGKPPVTREFDEWDAARFSEMLQSDFHNLPCPAILEAETMELRHANWRLGDFKFEVSCSNPEYRVTLFAWGMALRRNDVVRLFGVQGDQSIGSSKPEPSKAEVNANGRAPSVKAGRPPSDDEILAKAEEMKTGGLDGRTIAKSMRYELGFENVANTTVRELILGRWPPGGRPKKKGA